MSVVCRMELRYLHVYIATIVKETEELCLPTAAATAAIQVVR